MMTEGDWSTERKRPYGMLSYLRDESNTARTRVGKRKLRLFACGCCRLIWHLIKDERLRLAVETAERFADGQGKKEDLTSARTDEVRRLGMGGYSAHEPGVQERTAARLAVETTALAAIQSALGVTGFPLPLAGYTDGKEDGKGLQCGLIRCIFGNPFRTSTLDPTWLTPTVRLMAEGIYQERNFDDLPILADALEDAGCSDEQLLTHCREAGPHARGCWVIDLLTRRS